MNLNVNHEFLQSPIWNSRILFICCAGPCPSTVHTIAHIYFSDRALTPLSLSIQHPHTNGGLVKLSPHHSLPFRLVHYFYMQIHTPTSQRASSANTVHAHNHRVLWLVCQQKVKFVFPFWNSRKEFTFRNSRFFGRYPRGYTRIWFTFAFQILELWWLPQGMHPHECKCFRNFRTLVVTPGDTPTLSVSVKFSFVKSSFGRKANFNHLVSFPRGKLWPEPIRTSWWLSIGGRAEGPKGARRDWRRAWWRVLGDAPWWLDYLSRRL